MATNTESARAAARRANLLELIKAHVEKHGYPPSQVELAKASGVHHRTVQTDLDLLVETGHVTLGGRRRTITLTGYDVRLIPKS